MAPPNCATLDQRQTATEGSLARIEEKLTVLDRLSSDMKEVIRSMQFMNETFESFKTELAATKKEMEGIRKENVALRKRNDELESKSDDLDAYIRRNNIVIRNVPERQGESTDAIIEKVADLLEIPMPPDVIEASHRLPSRNSSLPKPIVVRFTNRRYVERIIAGAKAKRISTKELGFPGEIRPVFFGEHLSPLRQQVFGAALEAKRRHQWKFLWTSGGRILARRAEGDPVHHIDTKEDIAIFGRA